MAGWRRAACNSRNAAWSPPCQNELFGASVQFRRRDARLDLLHELAQDGGMAMPAFAKNGDIFLCL
jgi:hypothetical protein